MLSLTPINKYFNRDLFSDPFKSTRNELTKFDSPFEIDNWFSDFDKDPFFKDIPIESPFEMKEEDHEYTIQLNDIKDKEFKVDFNKKENKLSIETTYQSTTNNEDGESSYTSSSVNSVVFDKEVSFDEIRSDADESNDSLVIHIPKNVESSQ